MPGFRAEAARFASEFRLNLSTSPWVAVTQKNVKKVRGACSWVGLAKPCYAIIKLLGDDNQVADHSRRDIPHGLIYRATDGDGAFHTNPKRKRGRVLPPHLRFGLVSASAVRGITGTPADPHQQCGCCRSQGLLDGEFGGVRIAARSG